MNLADAAGDHAFDEGDSSYVHGPTLCRVRREVVDGELVRVTLEPIANDQTVELAQGDEFITVLSTLPIVPLSVWDK